MKIQLTELSEGLRIAIQTLKTNKLRSVLTTLGIFIGVIVVTVIISVIRGLNAYVKTEIATLGADTVFISRYPWRNLSYEEYLKLRQRKNIKEEHYKFINKYATLAEAVAPDMSRRMKVKYRNESLDGVNVVGTSDGYMITANVMPEIGRFFNENEVNLRHHVCVIGWEVVDKLFKDENPIGKRLKIGPHQFFIIGVLEKRGKLFDYNLDDQIIIPYAVFNKLHGSHRSMDLQVKAKNPELVNNLIDELHGLMRQTRGLKVGEPDNFDINQQSQIMEIYNNLTQTLWIVVIGIGCISLLVGGIGIMNIMLVSVTERTHEIGIRKALGAKRRAILWQFLVESMFISGIGVSLGILASLGISTLVKSVSPLPVNLSTWILFLAIGFTISIGLFFGLYPASKASRLDPIEALRFE